MKHLACILLLMAQVSLSAWAQENPNAAIKEKIRDIKLDEAFLFAESAGTDGADNARSAATRNLHDRVVAWLTESGQPHESAENIWNRIKGDCRTLEYQSKTLHKAFAYLPKSSATAPDASDTPAEPAVPAGGQAASPASQPAETPATPPVSEQEPPLINLDDFDISEEELETPLSQDVSALLALDTYESVMLYLEAMQDDGRLVYGRIATLTNPEQAYLIIIKDGKLVAVLDKGKGERMNLKTKEMEIVKKYKGHAVIWMKTFK